MNREAGHLFGRLPLFAPHILFPPLRVFSSRLRSFAAPCLRLVAPRNPRLIILLNLPWPTAALPNVTGD